MVLDDRPHSFVGADQAAPGAAPPYAGVDHYVAAALAVADAEGLAAVSMRRAAGDLGSGTATLYRYLTKRDELVELMVDAVQGEDSFPEPTGDWRVDLAAVAHTLRATLLRHPWLAGELAGQHALTPDIALATQALGAVHAYVLGLVATQQAARRAEQRTGLTEEQWQRSGGPYISGSSPQAIIRCSPAASSKPRTRPR